MEGIDRLAKQAENLVVVTNELFSDGIEYSPETTCYLEYLGEINRRLGRAADVVCEVVYGIPVFHKE